jgi:hypothetical protein
MNTLFETLRGIKVLVTAKTIKGTSFIGVRGYENKQGEVSNQTLLVGYNYLNMLENDKQKLMNTDISSVITKYGEKVAQTALEELLVSLAKRTATEEEKEQLRKKADLTIRQSDAQLNAYTNLAKGIRLHNDSGQIHVTGVMVSKTIIEGGVYSSSNPRTKTLAKKMINKLANVQHAYVKTFILNKTEETNLQGVTL